MQSAAKNRDSQGKAIRIESLAEHPAVAAASGSIQQQYRRACESLAGSQAELTRHGLEQERSSPGRPAANI